MGWIIVVNEPGATPERFARTLSRAEADALAERIRASARRHNRDSLEVTIVPEEVSQPLGETGTVRSGRSR